MSKHTPGPWTAGQKSPATRSCVFLNGRAEPEPDEYLGPGGTWIDCNTEANARLIAAAPDLYETLCSMILVLTEISTATNLDLEKTVIKAKDQATGKEASVPVMTIFIDALSAVSKVSGEANE